MSISPIEWTEQTWNPIVGCSLKSPGCVHCYAMPMAARIEAINAAARPGHETAPHYAGTTQKVNGRAVWTGKIALAADEVLLAPLRRKKPTVYFVNSMGDLFHEDCSDAAIDRVVAVMALCPQHTFQVLTKRAARMRAYFADVSAKIHIAEAALSVGRNLPHGHIGFHPSNDAWTVDRLNAQTGNVVANLPLPNVWLGVSTERQQEADERIPELLRTPAAIRFISYEPALGPIDVARWLHIAWQCSRCEHLYAGRHKPVCPDCGQIGGWTGSHAFNPPRGQVGPGLDWVICGGESGPRARPMHPDWVRSLRDQCAAANVKFFFKQWGAFSPYLTGPGYRVPVDGFLMTHVPKKTAGRHLDGVEYNAMPAIRSAKP